MISHSKPTITSRDTASIMACVKSGALARGERSKQLEAFLSAESGYTHARLTSSATNAMYVSLLALYPKSKAKVAFSSYVCRAVYDAVTMAGCAPMVVDCDPDTYSVDQNAVIASGCDAVVVNHMFGIRAGFDKIKAAGITVIEDCAQRVHLGESARDEPKGDIRVYSFEATKYVTGGAGGALVTDDDSVNNHVTELLSDSYGRDEYCISSPFTDIQAALVHSQLLQLPSFIQKRAEIASYYLKSLTSAGLKEHIVSEMWARNCLYFRFVLSVDRADEIVEHAHSAGVHIKKPVKPMGLHTLIGEKGAYPHTERALRQNISLPLYPSLLDRERETVIHTLMSAYEKHQ